MKNRLIPLLILGLVVMMFVLAACQQGGEDPSPAEPVAAPTQVVADTPSPRPTATPPPSNTPVPTDTPLPTPTLTPEPTETPPPTPTASPEPTSTLLPTLTPSPQPTHTPIPTMPSTATLPPLPTATPMPPPVSGVAAAFLNDARQTTADLLEVKVWFDRLAGSESVSCAIVFDHSIHQPVSTAPAADPDLVGIWHEYQAAMAIGQDCLNWLVDFCAGGGGTIGGNDFWDRRQSTSRALSQAEHVVQALEALQ